MSLFICHSFTSTPSVRHHNLHLLSFVDNARVNSGLLVHLNRQQKELWSDNGIAVLNSWKDVPVLKSLPVSVLTTKGGDIKENSSSNDVTRQWWQIAGSFFFFCKLITCVKERPPWQVKWMVCLNVDHCCRPRRGKNKDEKNYTKDCFFVCFFFLHPLYLIFTW